MAEYVVIGLGNFGSNIATALAGAGEEVLVIDADPQRIEQIKDKVAEAVIGDARDKAMLAECVSNTAAAVIVNLGDTIEASALATLHLKELGVTRIIVKVADETQGTILKKIGAAEIVNPEKDTAHRLVEHLTTSNLVEHIPLADDYSIVEVAVPDAFSGKTLGELQLRSRYGMEIIVVKDVVRDEVKLIPGGDFRLAPDSVLVAVGKKDDVAKMRALFG